MEYFTAANWNRVEVRRGNAWKLVEIHGSRWKLLEISKACGSLWKSMEARASSESL